MGRALFGVVAVFAQLCVDTIRDNSLPGLEHARAVGRVGGQPCVMSPERTAAAARMREDGKTILQIADVLEVGKATVHRALRRLPRPPPPASAHNRSYAHYSLVAATLSYL